MTLIVVLLFGLGTVLVVSSLEVDPKTGKSLSVLQTIQDIWSGNPMPGLSSNTNTTGQTTGPGNTGPTGILTQQMANTQQTINNRTV